VANLLLLFHYRPSLADTFTALDLVKCTGWCLTDFKGPFNIYIGLWDRAMLLTSCSVAFQDDNTRSLLLSDLFMTDVMMNAKGLGETVLASAFLCSILDTGLSHCF
jgi:hypothetical protein